jgi:hypothetical protein
VGTVSTDATFTVAGSGLASNDTVTLSAPAGCEISTSSSLGFAGSLTLNANNSGSLSTTTIYARISASAAASVSGYLTVNDAAYSSTDKSVLVTGSLLQPGQPPVATVSTPSGAVNGYVPISYILTDADSETCNIQVQYSDTLDGPGVWVQAHSGPGGDGTTGLTSSPGGTTHTFLWNSYSDIGDANDSNVIIRIIPVGETTGTGSAVSTAPFRVLDASQTSAAWVTTPTSPQTGNISISYILADAGGFDCSVQVQYSPSGGNIWCAATPVSGGEGTAGLTSSTGVMAHTFMWDSASDIGYTTNSSVMIRVTPTDFVGTGISSTTAAFTVDNVGNSIASQPLLRHPR